MANAQACPVACEEVLDVESKWPYLPITPTYDQYVQRWVVMSEREGFHLKTRSAMKQLLEDAKWMVLNDKFKKRALFKIRVDLWRRLHNLPEDRETRAGLGAARRDRLEHVPVLPTHMVRSRQHQASLSLLVALPRGSWAIAVQRAAQSFRK